MTKQEFMAMSLPYGLKCFSTQTNAIYDIISMSFWNKCLVRVKPNNERDFLLPTSRILPILRPLSDLTKPISQANYNNGESFVPALELIKLEERYNKWKDIAPTIPYDVAIINKPFGQMLKVSKLGSWVLILSLNEIERAKYYIVSQLIKWHFNIADLISKGEAIDVNTLDTNSYK